MPCAVAVTWAVPTGPGVQICGVLSEFQVPAHASPLLAIVRTAVLLDSNETGVAIVRLMLFRGVAVKPIIAPTSIEALLAGLRLMLAGAGKFTVRAALVPQPAKAKIKVRTETPPIIETHNLPMNPPRLAILHGRACPVLENFQCRGMNGFQQAHPAREILSTRGIT